MKKKLMVLIGIIVFSAGICSAALLTPVSITGAGGTYYHDAGLIIDGTIPNEGSSWTGYTNTYWRSKDVYFTIDYGSDIVIEDIVVSVDNNDHYKIDYSIDGSLWTHLM